ncbi:MAG: hypothetical protein Q9167_006065 [Letrouitia subvulpina]
MSEENFRTSVSSERRRIVFLVGRTIFRGGTRPVDVTLFKKIIARNAHKLNDVYQKYGKERANNILWGLVEKGVFQSESNAKRVFPELYPEHYQVSAAQNGQQEMSQRNAAKAEAEMLEIVGSTEGLVKETRDGKPNSYRLQRLLQETKIETPPFPTSPQSLPQSLPQSQQYHSMKDNARRIVTDTKETKIDTTRSSPGPLSPTSQWQNVKETKVKNTPSLFPKQLSYTVQHDLLNTVQRVLEESCFEWTSHWIPSLLQDRGWTCAEAVELSQWSTILPPWFERVSADSTCLDSGEALQEVLEKTHYLRDAAVHRVPKSFKSIERMLKDSLMLVEVLYDTQRTLKLEELLRDFQNKAQDMEMRKNLLEKTLNEELQEIQKQRVALDRKENELKSDMLLRDRENTREISESISQSITKLRAAQVLNSDAKLTDNGEPRDELPDDDGNVGDTHNAEDRLPNMHGISMTNHAIEAEDTGTLDEKFLVNGDQVP